MTEFTPNNIFHTPESMDEITNWVESHDAATRGHMIVLMGIYYNYIVSNYSLTKEPVKPILTLHEVHALGEYLSEWPVDMTFDAVLETMFTDNPASHKDGIEPCEFFEDWNPAALGERIKMLERTLREGYGDGTL